MTEMLPAVFLPYQQQLWTEVEANRLLLIEKSRRTGYSWALGAIAAATAAATRQAGGMNVFYVGYEKEMTREFIGYVADFASQFQQAAAQVAEDIWEDPDHPEQFKQVFRVSFASGFSVVSLPSVPRALRGKQGMVILDEAAFMDDLEGVLTAALALLLWGGRVVVCSTHQGENNRFNELITEIRSGRRKGKVLRLTFEEALEQGLYKRICMVSGQAWSQERQDEWVADIRGSMRERAEEELDVIPNPTTGAYLPGALLDARADKSASVLRWTAPPGFTLWADHVRQQTVEHWCREELAPILSRLSPEEPHCLGEDFARVKDLTVLWLLAIARDLSRPCRLVVELRQMPYEQQRQVVFFILDRVQRFRAAIFDAGGNGGYLAEVTMQKFGERVQCLQLSEPWYRENMPYMKAALEDGMMTLPADREVQDDFRMLRLVRGVARIPERRLNDEKQMRHGDAAIAACLAYAASRMEPEEYGYTPAPPLVLKAGDGTRKYREVADDEEDDRRDPRAGEGWMPDLQGSILG